MCSYNLEVKRNFIKDHSQSCYEEEKAHWEKRRLSEQSCLSMWDMGHIMSPLFSLFH